MQEQPKKKHRKRKGFEEEHVANHNAHDESNWLVSYADMMTLLFGFFVLMYSFSKLDKQKFNSVRENLTTYFGGEMKEDLNAIALKDDIKDLFNNESVKSKDFQVSAADGRMVLKLNSDLAFASGSAEISDKFRGMLAEVVRIVKSRKKVRGVEVEGHTDIVPISSMLYPTNWELSAARATRVVRELIGAGVKPKLISAKGFGASRPVARSKDKAGKLIRKNLSKNRRVVINIDFGQDVDAAEEALNTKKFVRKKQAKTKNTKKARRPGKVVEKRSQSGQSRLPTSKSAGAKAQNPANTDLDLLKDRLLKAQSKFQEANRRAREKQQKEAARQKMLEKIRMLEQQTQELQGN